jgi:hypothetical protein
MKKFNYKTIFYWKNKELYIFYKYHTGLYIPTGINFIYKKKHYSTPLLMTRLNILYNQHKFPTQIYDKDYWLTDLKTKFIKFSNVLV